jgi:mannose-1-phosphate guanylyltransferase/mannose-1-phosphate guanylyltransferase/mannose-6-phosphate isomerase
LSGGAGRRLWPLSRAGTPKQLAALVGDGSLLLQTARRVADPDLFDPPIAVASAADAEAVEAQLAQAGTAPSLLILEPCGRNTAPAIALAAASCAPGDLLLVLPSDHRIEDEAAFRAAVEAALPLAEQGWLVTFGIAPDRPETGYGYIKRGDELGPGLYRAAAFVEKPGREAAEAMLAQGGHDWNAGIFLFRADACLEALERHAPDVKAAAQAALAAGRKDGLHIFPDAEAFAGAPSLPIDVAVMERSDRVAVVPVAMGWSDVGSWDAIHALGAPDSDGNVVAGDVLTLESKGCLVRSDGPTIVAVGIEDLIVIATGDAVLVVPRGQSQRVKEALDALEARGQKAGGS